MKHENLKKSHGILSILPFNFTKFVPYMPILGNVASIQKVRIVQPISAKFEPRDCHGKSRNSRGKLMEQRFAMFVRTLITITDAIG